MTKICLCNVVVPSWFLNASKIPVNKNKLSNIAKQTSNQLKKLDAKSLPRRTLMVVKLKMIPIEPMMIDPQPSRYQEIVS